MSGQAPEDATLSNAHRRPAAAATAGDTQQLLAQRWVDLRELLIRQLDSFERGDLALRADGADVSAAAMADLRRSILEFDELIAGSRALGGGPAQES